VFVVVVRCDSVTATGPRQTSADCFQTMSPVLATCRLPVLLRSYARRRVAFCRCLEQVPERHNGVNSFIAFEPGVYHMTAVHAIDELEKGIFYI